MNAKGAACGSRTLETKEKCRVVVVVVIRAVVILCFWCAWCFAELPYYTTTTCAACGSRTLEKKKEKCRVAVVVVVVNCIHFVERKNKAVHKYHVERRSMNCTSFM